MRGNWSGLALGAALCLGGCYSGIGVDDAELQPDGSGSTGGGQGDGGSDGGGDDGGPAAQCADADPSVAPSGIRLLTRYEYDNTVEDLLGDTSKPAQAFVPENQTTAFENSAADHRVSAELVRQYMDASEDIAEAAVAERLGELLPCDPLVDGEAQCGHAFVDAFLPRAFRRPPTDEERTVFVTLFDDAHAEYGFTEAVGLVVQATLQSPQFLYRIEPTPEGAQAGEVVEVTGYEMASRLSYFLTASMPDEELLAAAQGGGLATVDDVEAQARRLLETERGRRAVREFHRQWLHLNALSSVSKDPTVIDGIDPTLLGAGWKESVERFTDYVFFDSQGTIEELLLSQDAFLPEELATVYGAGAADPVTGAVTLPGERAGLLTQPGLMALLAYPDQSSPIARGVFVRERMLCQHLPPPPDDVVIEPPDPDPNATTRERFGQHTADPACAGCHSLIDPIGFGFEHYDAIGAWRTEENGASIDASGELLAIEDDDQAGAFDGAVELSQRLADSSDFEACVVHQWSTFALGREPTEDDACSTQSVRDVLAESGGDLREMLVAIAVSDAFRFRVAQGGSQ